MRRMGKSGRVTTGAIVLTFACGTASVAQDVTGLWANQPEACDTIFVKHGNRIEFSPKADFHGSGFIIEGDVIRGKMATCKIRKKVRKGDMVTITAACATAVMVADSIFKFRTDEPDAIVRLAAGSSALDTKYVRCSSK